MVDQVCSVEVNTVGLQPAIVSSNLTMTVGECLHISLRSSAERVLSSEERSRGFESHRRDDLPVVQRTERQFPKLDAAGSNPAREAG